MAVPNKNGAKKPPDPTIWGLVKKGKFWSFCRASFAILGILYLLGLAGQLRPWEGDGRAYNAGRVVSQVMPSARCSTQSEVSPPTSVYVQMYLGDKIEDPANWTPVELKPGEIQVVEFEASGRYMIRWRPDRGCSACLDFLDGGQPTWVRHGSGLQNDGLPAGKRLEVYGTGTILFQVIPDPN